MFGSIRAGLSSCRGEVPLQLLSVQYRCCCCCCCLDVGVGVVAVDGEDFLRATLRISYTCNCIVSFGQNGLRVITGIRIAVAGMLQHRLQYSPAGIDEPVVDLNICAFG